MPSFSQRKGIKPLKTVQIDSMDNALRNGLWNMFDLCYWSQIQRSQVQDIAYHDELRKFCNRLWIYFFEEPLDTMPGHWMRIRHEIRDRFFRNTWNYYDFVEFVVEAYDDKVRNREFQELCSDILEKAVSGYRFIDGKISQITDQREITAVEEALATEDSAVEEHLSQAVKLFSDRKSPDYRNSIKESISAVEAMCQQITGKPGATLGEALKHFEGKTKAPIHPALKDAFSKLYGWTSDAKGIRHAIAFPEDKPGFEDAKYMLVGCSAFINYLKAKM